jgi:hypothetical protein
LLRRGRRVQRTARPERSQIGAGEDTFQGRNRYHGAVFVRIADGKIANWREYQYRSQLPWEEFVGVNRF